MQGAGDLWPVNVAGREASGLVSGAWGRLLPQSAVHAAGQSLQSTGPACLCCRTCLGTEPGWRPASWCARGPPPTCRQGLSCCLRVPGLRTGSGGEGWRPGSLFSGTHVLASIWA